MEGNGEFKKVKKPAVFIDRDGTINEQMGYINHLSRFKILPGVADGIKMLNEHDHLAIIVSNQSGVGRGYFPIDLVHRVHDYLKATLEEQGARIDGIYFCPHYPGAKVPEFNRKCDCRKPETGLIDQAREAFDLITSDKVIENRFDQNELKVIARNLGLTVRGLRIPPNVIRTAILEHFNMPH